VNPRVFEAFLHARSLWDERSPEQLDRAVAILKQALEWDPRYAPAHGALGACYVIMLWWGRGSPGELAPKITAAATRALELDPDIAAAKATLAYVSSLIERRPTEADALLEQAVTSDPTSLLSLYLGTLHRIGQGLLAEAVGSANAALELDPFSLSLDNLRSYTLYVSRRYEEALDAARRTIELHPSNGPAYGRLALSYDQLGQLGEALAAARKWVALSPDAPGARGALAHALARNGRRVEAAVMLEHARHEASLRYIVPSTYAPALCALDDREGAFEWLNLAVTQHCCWLAPMLADPRLDGLRPELYPASRIAKHLPAHCHRAEHRRFPGWKLVEALGVEQGVAHLEGFGLSHGINRQAFLAKHPRCGFKHAAPVIRPAPTMADALP
jgi:serine/threonine-protein kinase